MRNILLTIIIFLISYQLFSQNLVDPVGVFDQGLRPNAINLNNNEFIRGWNWSSPGAIIDAAMGINWYHSMNLDSLEMDYNQDNRLLQPLTHPSVTIIGGRKSIRLFQGHSLHLDPKIIVDSTSNFVPRAFDSTGSVFGFLNKNKVRILNSTQDTSKDYHFAMLDKDSISSPEIVLSHIWKNNII